MALGAEHVEPADPDDLVVLLVGLLLELAVDRLVLGLVLGALLRFHLEQEVAVVVPFARRHLLPGEVLGVAAEQDVDAAAGHVRRDGHRADPAGLRDDHRLLLVVLRVQDVVLDPAPVRAASRASRTSRSRPCPRAPAGPARRGHEVLDDRVPLRVLDLVDQVLLVAADHLPVGGDLGDVEVVDGLELGQLGLRRSGHAGELVVHLEVVLDRDRREGLVLLLDPDALLGLDRLVQPLGVAPALEYPAGELVDDLHLAVRDDVLDVAVVVLLGPERVLQVVDERRMHVLVQVVDAERLLDLGDALLGDGDGASSPRRPRSRRRASSRGAIRANVWYHFALSATMPLMISGVRASSIRIESTSSTIAYAWPRWTMSSGRMAMLSRR